MNSTSPQALEERVLVLAPTGRDASVTCEVLARAGILAEGCETMEDVCARFAEGAGGIILAEEALTPSGVALLTRTLGEQPPWSDIPIVVLTATGETTEARVRAIRALAPSGNLSILERPARVFTLTVTVEAMLRARRRQYQMRDLHVRVQAQMNRLQAERELRARFVSTLAHDLRGPVAAAMLAAERLIRVPEQLEQRRDIGVRIKRNLERIEQMVRDLLDASRIQAGRPLPLRLDDCELTTIAYEVMEELNNLHGDRVRLDTKEEVRGVWSSEELRRAVWNLTTNAIKYGTPQTSVTITVRKAGGRARIAVHNEGTPISVEDQTRIFDPFARTKSAENGTQLGWGLGLTLVRGCAESHGGSIQVESSPESGTTFTIELPLDARAHQARTEQAAAS